ncbi:hypothetical protein VTJ04DRAFT_4506 [Mycothermus thermophilus]|uniref:uncharacterized protein n=1 Tax=Humicola insolens TaxID=85995 RepID=UPI0037448D81
MGGIARVREATGTSSALDFLPHDPPEDLMRDSLSVGCSLISSQTTCPWPPDIDDVGMAKRQSIYQDMISSVRTC